MSYTAAKFVNNTNQPQDVRPDNPLPITPGATSNVASSATVAAAVTLASDLAVVAIVANTSRKYLAITVTTKDAFIRLIPSATDNAVRKGILVSAGSTYEMATDAIYTGEVSIINTVNAEAPVFFVTEY